ncbi:MFS transporter [Marinococcus luteus]|uniref:MFS transporter n=1 Tax=Marinococcus luteus TaxID=1122204 RepID=UPI002ACD097E|nr:MFS transporter [Marinococcus luteus]MDZ5783860.1 MFS transporter [Marinococcus luteus]
MANESLHVGPAQKKKLIFLVALILTIAVMNGTMFNVAIPDIQSYFGIPSSQVSWVLTSYIMVYAIGALMYGKLADFYSIKALLTFGIILFAAGATLGLFSQSFAMLLVARVLQAAGGATIPALGFVIPARFFPEDKGRVFGLISSTVAFASGVGPIVGGLLGGWLSWRYLFLFSILSLLALPFLRKWLPDEEKRSGFIDYLGAALFGAAIAGILLFVTTLQWIFLLMFIVFMAVFSVRTAKADDPFIRPSLLKNKYYTVTILTSFLGVCSMFGLLFIIPLMTRELYELSTTQIGLVIFPGAILAGFLGRTGGDLADRHGPKVVVIAALVFIAFGTMLLSGFAGVSAVAVSVVLIIAYIGFPLIQSSTANILSSVLEENETGVGIGMFNLMNFMAGAFSSAIFGAVLEIQGVNTSLNPFASGGSSAIYSNVYLALTLISLFALAMFTYTFRAFRVAPQSEKNPE